MYMIDTASAPLKIFTCNSNPELAKKICQHIGIPLGNSHVGKFSDGEIQIRLEETVRGVDVYVIQSTCDPVNQHLMELLVMVDALRRASAGVINVVLPYYGYARQDRKAQARDPVTAKLVANLITTAGADRVITIDLHAPQIQGFFDIPVDQLIGVPILARYFQEKQLDQIVVVSPDHGGVIRARRLAERLGAPIAIIDKRRPAPNVAEVMNIVGEVKGRRCIIIDDIIDTAGTITLAANALMEQGAQEVYACCTHPVFSGPAIERIENSNIVEMVVTDTIPLPPEKMLDKMKVLTVAPLLGEAIVCVHEQQSVSKLFD
ncbi:ribose-phosphate pyrophosphokinase [Seinonella peptonophila]|uniref:Ribose-phosphate pyrophosphokinase n=2 Tax=Seinonella peptonophila TaxID=112248 RepID=A0A1M4YM58_9BACL|nr:ribose-phosphate pyrophosphokinase [Seinonella peptonophila]